jgi:hypothetical protein
MYRQGDVSLHKIEKMPEKIKKAKNNILAYGEITGHQHRLKSKQILVFEDAQNNKFIELKQDTELIHDNANSQGVSDLVTATQQDKHLKFIVQKGVYVVKYEREFDVFSEEIKQVVD